MNYFVTGIGTDVGKTIVSAILTEALEADYWKPIQSGTKEGFDSDQIKSLITNTKTVCHPESYLLKEPLSPHFAAKLENIEIDLEKIVLPQTQNHLIIEGAGGLLVPINKHKFVIDIAKKINCDIVLVISNYLGCINHSLLSIDYLQKNNFKLYAIIFNGEFETEVKNAIISYSSCSKIISISTLSSLSKLNVIDAANNVKNQVF